MLQIIKDYDAKQLEFIDNKAKKTLANKMDDKDFSDIFYQREKASILGMATLLKNKLSKNKVIKRAKLSNYIKHFKQERVCEGYWYDFTVLNSECFEKAKNYNNGIIIAPFHFGDYRTISLHYINKSIDVYFLADENNTNKTIELLTNDHAKKYEKEFYSKYLIDGLTIDKIKNHLFNVSSLSLSSLWRLQQGLKKGGVAIMFPDGNTGMSHSDKESECFLVEFLNKTIKVRTGIPTLSYFTKSPILPVIPLSNKDEISCLKYYEPIMPEINETKEEYISRAIVSLFKILEVEISKHPHLWEEWPHIPNWIVNDNSIHKTEAVESSNIDLNKKMSLSENVWTFKCDQNKYIYNLDDFNLYDGGSEFTELIDMAESGCLCKEWSTNDNYERLLLLKESVKMGIINLE